jgi:hypothetical protein
MYPDAQIGQIGIIRLNNLTDKDYREVLPNEYITALSELSKIKGIEEYLPSEMLELIRDKNISKNENYAYNYTARLLNLYHKKGITSDRALVYGTVNHYVNDPNVSNKEQMLNAILNRIRAIRTLVPEDILRQPDYVLRDNELALEYKALLKTLSFYKLYGRDAYNSIKDISSLEKWVRSDIENKNPYFQWVFDAWYKAKTLAIATYDKRLSEKRKFFAPYLKYAKSVKGGTLTQYEGKYYEDLFEYIEIEVKDEKGNIIKEKINTYRLITEKRNKEKWDKLSKEQKEFIKSFNAYLSEMLIESLSLSYNGDKNRAKSVVNSLWDNIEGMIPVMRITSEQALFQAEFTGSVEVSIEKLLNQSNYYDASNKKNYYELNNYLAGQLISFSDIEYGSEGRKKIIGWNGDSWDIKQNKRVSTDLFSTLNYFEQQLLKKKFMDEVSDIWHIASALTNIREAETGMSQKNNLEIMASAIKRKLYGERLQFSDNETLRQVENSLMIMNNAASYLALAFNFTSNLKSFASQMISITSKAFGSKFTDRFGQKDLMFAIQEVATNPKKALAIAEKFGLVNSAEMERVLNKRLSGVNQGIMSNIKISNDIPFIFDQIGDYFTKLTVLVAQMKKEGTYDALSLVEDKETNTFEIVYDRSKDKRPKEIINYIAGKMLEQGLIQSVSDMNLPYDAEQIMRLDVILNRVASALTESSETLAQTTPIGKSLLKFKMFQMPILNSLFRQSGTNFNYRRLEMENGKVVEVMPYEESMYKTLVKSIGIVLQYKGDSYNIIKEQFSDEQRNNLINASINVVSLGILYILAKLSDDDEEDKKRRRKLVNRDEKSYLLLSILNSALNDISMFKFFSFDIVNKNPFAGLNVIQNFAGGLWELMTLNLDKGTKKLINSVGIINSIDNFYKTLDSQGYKDYRKKMSKSLQQTEDEIWEMLDITD